MTNKDCPCIACPDRHATCHAECERYKTWAAAVRQARRDAWEKAHISYDARSRIVESCIDMRTRKHRIRRK